MDKYLTEVRAPGRYSFTLDELQQHFGLPYLTLKQGLYRLKLKKEIAVVNCFQNLYLCHSETAILLACIPRHLL
ncbi:hypothetical protein FACS189413_19300 [Bacteroidia bacterium]|nr:hypothetical protein FACS189413_19300 [Bacteroidia bacterium]